jgi:hypothetical protein
MYKAAFVGVSVTAMAYMSKTRFPSMFNQISDCDEGKSENE